MFYIIKLYKMLTTEQRLSKTILCFCQYCNGYGIILHKFNFYKNYKTSSYEECRKCKGTGLAKNWWKTNKIVAKDLINSK